MKNVLVIGSTCVDVILRIDHLPKTEENIHPHSQRFAVGGCAYNVANILGRAGADMTFVTPVGRRGIFGGFVREKLNALGFTDYVDLPEEENGCCYCFVEKNGERTFASLHGAEYTFDPAWMARYAGMRFDYGYVCGLEIEERTGEKLVEYLETAPIDTLVYAPGPRGVRIKKELTDRLYALHPVLHINAGEARAMAGTDDLTPPCSASTPKRATPSSSPSAKRASASSMIPASTPCPASLPSMWSTPSARAILTPAQCFWDFAAA